MSKTAIVLDKCFIQSTNKIKILELARLHRLIISDALFYELLTENDPKTRSKCFAKFLPNENPVDLVSHIGTLMRIEIDRHQAAGKPSQNRELIRFQFNPQLIDSEYKFPKEVEQEIFNLTTELKTDVKIFSEIASMTPSFFPNLFTGTQAQRDQAKKDAEEAIASPDSLLDFYSKIESPYGEKPLPPAILITQDWAIYRWLQVRFLFALDLYLRYHGNIPIELSANVYEKMEHDVLDAQILMLGCLEGAFATNEKKLKRWFRLLCPNGILYDEHSMRNL